VVWGFFLIKKKKKEIWMAAELFICLNISKNSCKFKHHVAKKEMREV